MTEYHNQPADQTLTAALDPAERLKAERGHDWQASYDVLATDFEARGKIIDELETEITRLTSQLEQAERFAELISDGFEYQDYSDCADDEPMVIDATVGDMRRASQWIKDRQAKGDHIADVGKKVDPLSGGDK